MYERVTELDSNFRKYWTFNPLDKEDLPEFVINSDKSFRIHIKYFDFDFDEESDEESDEENEEEEMIENLKDFLKAYSTRIVSFTMTLAFMLRYQRRKKLLTFCWKTKGQYRR